MEYNLQEGRSSKKPGYFVSRIVFIIFVCLVVALLITVAVLAALYSLAIRDLNLAEKQAKDTKSDEGLTELQCDVAVLGGGVSGLYIAETLLRENKEANVCVFESEARFGGRIKDHRFKRAPNISLALGAMHYMETTHHSVRNILRRFNISTQPWDPKYVGYESRGFISTNSEEIKRKAYPSLSLRSTTNGSVSELWNFIFSNENLKKWHRSPSIATYLSRLVGTEGKNFLGDISRHNGFATFGSSPSLMVLISYGAETAVISASQPHAARPIGGMSRITEALITSCRRHGVYLYGNETVTRLDSDGAGYLIRTSRFQVRAKAVVNTLAPFYFKEISGTTPKRILKDDRFKALTSVEVFRAGLLYTEPWWERFDVNNVTIRPLTRYVTHSNCLGAVLPYSGRGPSGEAALQVIYTDSPCSKQWKSIVSFSKESFNLEVKRSLQDAFPGVEVPDAVEATWQYWPSAWMSLKPGSEIPYVNISDWATRPLEGENFFMAGEAYTLLLQGWTEGALISAERSLKEGWGIELSATTKDLLARYREAWGKMRKFM